jgi:Putative Actinobacterial Holin-X, holin superfamily III
MASTPYGSTPVTSAAKEDRESQSAIGLLRRLVDELSTLIRQELALATAEISRSMRVLLTGAASLAVGGAVLYTGFLALVAAAILGLAKVLAPWLATVAIGGAILIVGAVLVIAGIRSLDPSTLKPSRTRQSLRRDKDLITRRPS